MSSREDVKVLLAKECWTITKLAEEMAKKTNKRYSIKTLSQKLTNDTLRYSEFKTITEILGYNIKLEKN